MMTNVIIVTVIFAIIALFAHFTIVADPNVGWPLGQQIHNTVGIWWVVLATAACGSVMAFISWRVFRHMRKGK